MNYDAVFSSPRLALDKKATELLSPQQQKLYNRGIYAQAADNGFQEADRRLGTILPAACGMFAPLMGTSAPVMVEYFLYVDSLQDNSGPMAVQLRRLARAQDLQESYEIGVSVSHRSARVKRFIDYTSPTTHPRPEDLSRAFAPYLEYSADGEINLCAVVLAGQPYEKEAPGTGPVLESIEEMLANGDEFHRTPYGWRVILSGREAGGSVRKMYFDGGRTSAAQYRGACVYNNLEDDYYMSNRYFLTKVELEQRLKQLFSRHGWTAEAYQATSLTPEAFSHALQAIPAVWKPLDFTHPALTAAALTFDDENYGYRDRLQGGFGPKSVPSSLAALDYTHPQRYMEWVEHPLQPQPELATPEAPVDAIEDRYHFYAQWNIDSNNTIYVRGCYTTGTLELSRNRTFVEERHYNQAITLTDGSRYLLIQWLLEQRKEYLDEVLSWCRRVTFDPPQYLLDAQHAYLPDPCYD